MRNFICRLKFIEKIHHSRSLIALLTKFARMSIVFNKILNKYQTTAKKSSLRTAFLSKKIYYSSYNKILNKYQSAVFLASFESESDRLFIMLMKIKKALITQGLFYINSMLNYFFFSSRPNGRVFAKSTSTGAATKIEE